MDPINSQVGQRIRTEPDLSFPEPHIISQSPLDSKHTSALVVSLWLMFFWPYAFYLMYKEKRYHRWFGYFLITGAILPLLTIFSQFLVVIPNLSSLYTSLGVTQPKPNLFLGYVVPIALSLTQIALGIVLLLRSRNADVDSYRIILITSIVLIIFGEVVSAWTISAMLMNTILPIYTLTHSL